MQDDYLPQASLSQTFASAIRTSTCRRVMQGQFPHLTGHGKVYICPIDQQYWRSIKRASDVFRPLDYR
jgi:hypothetical protein